HNMRIYPSKNQRKRLTVTEAFDTYYVSKGTEKVLVKYRKSAKIDHTNGIESEKDNCKACNNHQKTNDLEETFRVAHCSELESANDDLKPKFNNEVYEHNDANNNDLGRTCQNNNEVHEDNKIDIVKHEDMTNNNLEKPKNANDNETWYPCNNENPKDWLGPNDCKNTEEKVPMSYEKSAKVDSTNKRPSRISSEWLKAIFIIFMLITFGIIKAIDIYAVN
ncbi:7757_t:CDS:2, partial [Dentiscutata erythropus]